MRNGFETELKELFSFYLQALLTGLRSMNVDHVMNRSLMRSLNINLRRLLSWNGLPPLKLTGHGCFPAKLTAWFKIIFDKFYNHIFSI